MWRQTINEACCSCCFGVQSPSGWIRFELPGTHSAQQRMTWLMYKKTVFTSHLFILFFLFITFFSQTVSILLRNVLTCCSLRVSGDPEQSANPPMMIAPLPILRGQKKTKLDPAHLHLHIVYDAISHGNILRNTFRKRRQAPLCCDTV